MTDEDNDRGTRYTTASPEPGVVVLSLEGDIDLTASARLEYSIRYAETIDPEVFVIDLEQVTFMDSTGVNALIAAELRAREAAWTLFLTGLHRARRTLEVAGLLAEFRLADDIAGAIAMYREGRFEGRDSSGGPAAS